MPWRMYSATGTLVFWCRILSCASCSGVMYTVVEIFFRMTIRYTMPGPAPCEPRGARVPYVHAQDPGWICGVGGDGVWRRPEAGDHDGGARRGRQRGSEHPAGRREPLRDQGQEGVALRP